MSECVGLEVIHTHNAWFERWEDVESALGLMSQSGGSGGGGDSLRLVPSNPLCKHVWSNKPLRTSVCLCWLFWPVNYFCLASCVLVLYYFEDRRVCVCVLCVSAGRTHASVSVLGLISTHTQISKSLWLVVGELEQTVYALPNINSPCKSTNFDIFENLSRRYHRGWKWSL